MEPFLSPVSYQRANGEQPTTFLNFLQILASKQKAMTAKAI
jgi:hypothetical protein